MKASLFSPILILLIITLFAKASMLFGRIQEQTSYSVDTSTSSVLVDTAYAKSSPESEKSDNSVPEDTNSNKKPKKEPTKAAADNPGAVIKDNPGKAEKKPLDNLSRSEMDLLKELSKRRDTLDKEKKDMNVREQVLKATENKIDQKVGELKNLQSQLEVLMKQYDQKENSKILSLVKI